MTSNSTWNTCTSFVVALSVIVWWIRFVYVTLFPHLDISHDTRKEPMKYCNRKTITFNPGQIYSTCLSSFFFRLSSRSLLCETPSYEISTRRDLGNTNESEEEKWGGGTLKVGYTHKRLYCGATQSDLKWWPQSWGMQFQPFSREENRKNSRLLPLRLSLTSSRTSGDVTVRTWVLAEEEG